MSCWVWAPHWLALSERNSLSQVVIQCILTLVLQAPPITGISLKKREDFVLFSSPWWLLVPAVLTAAASTVAVPFPTCGFSSNTLLTSFLSWGDLTVVIAVCADYVISIVQ